MVTVLGRMLLVAILSAVEVFVRIIVPVKVVLVAVLCCLLRHKRYRLKVHHSLARMVVHQLARILLLVVRRGPLLL
jgi:hypothetical protein